MTQPSKIPPAKTCTCGVKHREIPEDARPHPSGDEFAGWYWECSCGSTLFVQDSLAGQVEEDADDEDTADDLEDEKDREFEAKKAWGML